MRGLKIVLNVAEKPSVAKEISSVLAANKQVYIPSESKYNPIYQFDFNLNNSNVQMQFTSVTGHIKKIDFAAKYRNWRSVTPLSLLEEAEIEGSIDPEKKPLMTNLMKLAEISDQIILWLDCDREGEAIAFEVLEIVQAVNPDIKVSRAHFSAVTHKEVWKAIKTLKEPDRNLKEAVDARQELDLRIGAAFTRFQTLTLRPVFPSLDGSVISYGPCQFPTLGFVVERSQEVGSFTPEQFWYISCRIKNIDFRWNRNHLFDEYTSYLLYDRALDNCKGEILSRSVKEKKKFRPVPLSTIELQKMATRKLGLSSHKLMEVAEKLYNKGFLSYPRTETDSYPSSLNLKDLIEIQSPSSQWGTFATKLLDKDKYFPRNGGHDDKAHPPIHPVKLAKPDTLVGDELKVYEFCVRHFLATVSEDAIGEETVIEVGIGKEKFHTKGLIIKKENFLEVYSKYDRWNANLLPDFTQGEELIPERFDVSTGWTTPPNYLTETDLITLMDKNGIGTDATIHEHIKTIQDRKYAVKNGGLFKPTSLGLAIVNAYEALGYTLAKPILRAKMERMMHLIAEGKMSKSDMLSACIEEMSAIYKEVSDKPNLFIENVKKFYKPEGRDTTSKLGKCKTCSHPMDLRNDSEASLSCGNCKFIYRLPENSDFFLSGQTCQTCGSDVFM